MATHIADEYKAIRERAEQLERERLVAIVNQPPPEPWPLQEPTVLWICPT